jgi:hypothetical protein
VLLRHTGKKESWNVPECPGDRHYERRDPRAKVATIQVADPTLYTTGYNQLDEAGEKISMLSTSHLMESWSSVLSGRDRNNPILRLSTTKASRNARAPGNGL